MSTEIRVPQLPESVADATLVAWHKRPGDRIARDENLADLETDKVVLEVPAPANGVVREIKVPSGAVVKSGELLALIEEGAAPESPAKSAAPAAAKGGSRNPTWSATSANSPPRAPPRLRLRRRARCPPLRALRPPMGSARSSACR